jgi:hypothetical protein
MELKMNDYAIVAIAVIAFAAFVLYLVLRSQKISSVTEQQDFRGFNFPGIPGGGGGSGGMVHNPTSLYQNIWHGWSQGTPDPSHPNPSLNRGSLSGGTL